MQLDQKFINAVKKKIANGEDETKIRKWIGEKLGKSKSRRNAIFRAIKAEAELEEIEQAFAQSTEQAWPVANSQVEVEITGDEAVAKSNPKTAYNLETLSDLIEFSGLDEDNWEVVEFGATCWDGKVGVKGKFKKKVEENRIENLWEDFMDRAAAHAPQKWFNIKNSHGDYMYVLNIQDLHLSKLCWAPEAGQDYDLKIAKKYYAEAVVDLMEKVEGKNLERVVLIVGSDFFHTDTTNSTTTKGTYVDSDVRWTKTFAEGCDLIVNTVESIATKYDVSVVQIGGNHDMATSFYLGQYLKAWFRTNPKVTVDCSPATRKYQGFGQVLVGIAHGDSMKLADLPLVMMRENQSTISNYRYMEFLTGHLHTEKMNEIKGIKVRVSPALCPPDVWHDKNNYSFNIQTSQGLLYSKEWGLEAIYYSKPITVE